MFVEQNLWSQFCLRSTKFLLFVQDDRLEGCLEEINCQKTLSSRIRLGRRGNLVSLDQILSQNS